MMYFQIDETSTLDILEIKTFSLLPNHAGQTFKELLKNSVNGFYTFMVVSLEVS